MKTDITATSYALEEAVRQLIGRVVDLPKFEEHLRANLPGISAIASVDSRFFPGLVKFYITMSDGEVLNVSIEPARRAELDRFTGHRA